MATLFTKIIQGEIPCHKIYEDEHTFAFLDIHPKSEGHTLVVPKEEMEFVWDLDEETYAALFGTVQKVAKRLREVVDAPYVGELIVGVDVPHAHVHLIPFEHPRVLSAPQDLDSEPDHEALAKLAKRLAF